jgi:hypothetical protein
LRGNKPMKASIFNFVFELKRNNAYRAGNRVVANVDIGIIQRGEKKEAVAAGDHGAVTAVDPETGELTILMDRLIPALEKRRNLLFVQPEHFSRIRHE